MSLLLRHRPSLALVTLAALGLVVTGCAQGGDAHELADTSMPAVQAAGPAADTAPAAALAPAGDDGSVGSATRGHRLTMAEMQSWSGVIRALKARAKADPRFKLTLAYPADSSVESQVRVVEANPALREALKANNLASRDWVVLTATYIGASMAAQTDDPAQALSLDVNPENVAFLREHGPEINAMQR